VSTATAVPAELSTGRAEIGAGSFCALAGAIALGLAALAFGGTALDALRAAGGTALWLVPVSVGLRLARSWLRRAVVVAAIALGPLALFASLLKALTNHRPLGAATFAVGSLVLIGAAIAVVARLETVERAENGGDRRWVPALRAVSMAISFVVFGVVVAQASSAGLLAAVFGPVLAAGLGAYGTFGPAPRVAARLYRALLVGGALLALASALAPAATPDGGVPRVLFGAWGLG